MKHFGNGKNTAESVEKVCRLEPANESQAVTFGVKALKADLKKCKFEHAAKESGMD